MSTFKLRLRSLALASAVVLAVTGCGGSGGDTPPPDLTPISPSASLHLAFVQSFDVNGDASWGVIQAAGGPVSTFWPLGRGPALDFMVQARFDNDLASNVHRSGLLFVKNGQLFRRDLFGAADLRPEVRVSTITLADACDVQFGGGLFSGFGADFADSNRSWKIFEKRGLDAQCGTPDDLFYAVRTNMGPADAPLEIRPPIVSMHSAQGALTGWILRNGRQMQRVDANFANPVTLFSLPADDLYFDETASLRNSWVFTSGGNVYAVDLAAAAPAALTLVTTLLPEEKLEMTNHANKEDVIVVLNRWEMSVKTSRMLRYVSGTKAVNTIGQASYVTTLSVTPTHVVAHSLYGNMESLPLAGGAAQTLYTPTAPDAMSYVTQRGGERAWQDMRGSVISVNSDGSGLQTMQGAQIAGCIYQGAARIDSTWRECDAVMLVEGNVVRSYDAATGALRVTYGPVAPPSANVTGTFYFDYFTEWGQSGVLTHYLVDNATKKETVVNYFIKTDQAGVKTL